MLREGSHERLILLRAILRRLPPSVHNRISLLSRLDARINKNCASRSGQTSMERVVQKIIQSNDIEREKEPLRGSEAANLTRAWMRQQHEIKNLSATTEKRFSEIERQLSEEIPGGRKRVDDTLKFLLDRVEFVRRELMFEMRYGVDRDIVKSPGRKVQAPRVLEPNKLSAGLASHRLRLNLGCGHIAFPDYVNVDSRDLPGVDVVADVSNMPFDFGTIDEISSTHLLEHFPQEELRRRILPYWYNLQKSGGVLRAVAPDGEAMLAGVAEGSYSFADFREVLFGGQDYDGDFHFNLFTPDSLKQIVEEAGFVEIEIPVRGRRNGQFFEFELIAKVPAN
jgi:predicted SAM-dependent methyltransferase